MTVHKIYNTHHFIERANQKSTLAEISKIKTPTDDMTPYSTFCTRTPKLARDIFTDAVASLTTVAEGMPSCRIVTLLRQWVLTSYVFLVTSFAAILVGKRGIRSHHVKISGRSSLDEDTEEKCASQQWRTRERAYLASLTPPTRRYAPRMRYARLKLPTPLTQSVNNGAQFATLDVVFNKNCTNPP